MRTLYCLIFSFFLTLLLPLQQLAAKDKDKFVVVIDAGHGGGDVGTPHRRQKQDEKTIALNVALKLGKKIESNYKNVKVVYTRKTDVYPSLPERTQIAKKAMGDLFISIHVNAAADMSARGFETYVFGVTGLKGKSAAEQKRIRERMENERENLDISGKQVDFERDIDLETRILCQTQREKHNKYSWEFAEEVQSTLISSLKQTSYAKQVHNRGVKDKNIFVLCYSPMPAILVELGYMSNVAEERFINSNEAQECFANSLYQAFQKYKRKWDKRQLSNSETDKRESKPVVKEQPKPVVKEQPKEQPKPVVKEQPKEQPKPVVKEQPKEQPKPAVKEQPKEQPKPVVKEQPKEQPKPVVKEQPKPEVKEEDKPSPRPAVKVSTPTQPIKKTESTAEPEKKDQAKADQETKNESSAAPIKPNENQVEPEKNVTTPDSAKKAETTVEPEKKKETKSDSVKSQPAEPPVEVAQKVVTTDAAIGQPAPQPAAKPCTKIQFLSSSRLLKQGDKELKGLWPVEYYQDGAVYRYTYGKAANSSLLSSELKTVRALFPDAFYVRFDAEGKRIR